MSRANRMNKPEKARGKRVPVVVSVEPAREVVLTGEFTDWALDRVRLEKGTGNLWSTELMLPPGKYQYRLLVDGSWRNDPGSTIRIPNAFGTQNDILVVE